MKKATKILNSGNKNTYIKLKFTIKDPSYEEYQKVIKAINTIRCSDIVESEMGHQLPANLGKLIILKNLPRVSKLYSMTRPGVRIYNNHSFGWVYRIYHKENILMRYPNLFKWRSHRANIKVPLYNHIMNSTKDYYKHSDFISV